MAFAKSWFDGEQAEAPPTKVLVDANDDAVIHRIRCALMLHLLDRGVSIRAVARVVGVSKTMVSEYLAEMPEEAKAYFRGVGEGLIGDVFKPRPPGSLPTNPTRPISHRSPNAGVGRGNRPSAQVDARCLAAFDRFGWTREAAREANVRPYRLLEAIERRRRGQGGS